MGTIEGYIPHVICKGIKYYYLSSTDRWTKDFQCISIKDLNEHKLEVHSMEFPGDSSLYAHTKITIDSNTI